MDFEFNSLSKVTDPDGEAAEERKLFAMDLASEARETGRVFKVAEPEVADPAIVAAAPIVEPPESGVLAVVEEPSQMATFEAAAPETEEGAAKTAQPEGVTAEVGAAAPEGGEAGTATEEEPVDKEAEAKKKEAGSLDALMQLAAGKVSGDEVKLDVVAPQVKVSAFQSLSASRALDPESELALEDLVSTLTDVPPAQSADAATPSGGTSEAAKPGGGHSAAPAPTQAAAPQMMMPGPSSGSASAQIGELAGRAIAGVVSTPFIALSSAARHLANRFQSTGAAPPAPAHAASSLMASKGALPLPIANTLETITDWKCERIEKAGEAVVKAADEIMGTEEYVTWENDVREIAVGNDVTPFDVVRQMHTVPELAPLKEKMDRLWERHPDKVSAYRTACDDFERNIRNVVKEFPNSDNEVKGRVSNAMRQIEEKTLALPGFGDKLGDYAKGLAERVRELAKMIAEFVTNLVHRLGGKTRNTDLSMS